MEDVKKATREKAPQAVPPHFEPSQAATPFKMRASSGSPPGEQGGPRVRQEQATAWVQENQSLAVLGAFGVGVFIGVMMRH